MLKDLVEVRPLGGYRLHLRFEDGVEGDVDLGGVIEFKGIFAPLRDEKEFAKVRVHSELGTIVWPDGQTWILISSTPGSLETRSTWPGR